MTTVSERADKIRNGKPRVAEVPGSTEADKETELALLGSILLWPEKIDDVCLVFRPEDFYQPSSGMIFKAAAALHNENKPVDPLTVAERLQSLNQLSEIGGLDRIHACMESVPHGAHAVHYATQILERHQRRELIYAGQDAITYGHDATTPIDEGVNRAESRITKVLERLSAQKPVNLDDVMMEVLARLDGKHVPGLKTRFGGFDELIRGLHPGNLMILAARPSMGKTAFAVNIAERLAKDDVPVGISSLEQSKQELCDRLLCSETRLDMNTIREPRNITEAQRNAILSAAQTLSAIPLIIDDNPCSITMLEASARIMRRRDKIQLLVVDYLQLIGAADKRAPREQQVSDISRRMKLLAKSLEIPIICLAQLNREVEKDKDKRPKLSHLRESGSIEQDADIVAFIHRPDVYDEHDRPNEADLIVAKHRNGATGDVKLRFEKKWMQFQDLAPSFSSPPQSFQYESQDDGGFNDAANQNFR